MIDFKTEIKKYQPLLEIEEVEESIHSEEIKDIIDLLHQITDIAK